MSEPIIVYTDGACDANGKSVNRGGWGAVLRYKGVQKEICGGERNTTNQRMEMLAVIKALETITNVKDHKVIVHSDSAYVVNCINKKWYVKWRANGWMTANKTKPVENRDLWERMLTQIARFKHVEFVKVKGHAGIELNELADHLAGKGLLAV